MKKFLLKIFGETLEWFPGYILQRFLREVAHEIIEKNSDGILEELHELNDVLRENPFRIYFWNKLPMKPMDELLKKSLTKFSKKSVTKFHYESWSEIAEVFFDGISVGILDDISGESR